MWELYLITRLNAVENLFTACLIIGIVSLCFSTIPYVGMCSYPDDDFPKKMFNTLKKCGLIFLPIGMLGLTFVPNTKDMLLIYGGGTIIEYCQENNELKQIPDKTITIINQLLDDYIKDNEQHKH